jgi:hypothetical protein
VTPSMWVELLDSFLKLADRNVRIDLSGTDVRMPERFLNGPQIGTIIPEMCRETVA